MTDQPTLHNRYLMEAVESFGQATGKDDLWARLHVALRPFAITGCLYGFEALPIPDRTGSLLLMNSYSNEWFHDKLYQNLLYCDEYIQAARTEILPALWSDTSRLASATPTALRSLAIDYDYGVITGVTLPMRFAGGLGASGVGCHAEHLSFTEFDKIWAEHSTTIAAIIRAFDLRIREDHRHEFFLLTPQEKECLLRLAQGQSHKRIADMLTISDRQLGAVTAQIRGKLGAATTPQAVAAALIFKLIEL